MIFLTLKVPSPLPSRHMSDRVHSVNTCLKVSPMGVRNRNREVIERLDSKTLDARFTTEIQQGLNCSPFEAEAVLDVVKEVYFPFLAAESAQPAPGRITLIAVAADEPAGKPVALCDKQAVCLTLHRGTIDDRV